MAGIQSFKKATFCVKNLANRPAICHDFCLESDFLIHLTAHPELIEIPLNIKANERGKDEST